MNYFKWTKTLCLLMFVCVCASEVYAKPIDKETAKQIAQGQVKKNRKSSATKHYQNSLASEVSFAMEGEDQTFFVFNIGTDDGFIVVSGDDATAEILMSCEKGHFTKGEMPDNMMSWLEGYTEQIRWLRENGITKEQNRRKAGSFNSYYRLEDDPAKAERLARWNQDGYFGDNQQLLYNFGLPIVRNNGVSITASTGCLITAVAQVLYYHQWPKKIGPKNIPDYTTKTEKFPMNGFESGTNIDWGHIHRTYSLSDTYSKEERTAISDLMKMVGAAFKVDYKFEGSSANLSTTPSALVKYFGYHEMNHYEKKNYDKDKWLQMIYDELTTNGPVLYRGERVDSKGKSHGHAFIIDGIDGDKVWVNWGWGLESSTYTELELCNIGDRSYTNYQEAIFGVRPNKTGEMIDAELKVLTRALIAKAATAFVRNAIDDDFEEIPIQYTYTNISDDATFDIGFLVENQETGEQTFYSLFSRTLNGFKTTTANLKFTFGRGLDDGYYRIYGASCKYGENNLRPNYNKTSQYIDITILDNTLYVGKIENQTITNISDDATFDIGFLVENVETGEQTFYSLFSRTLNGFKTTTANLKFTFGRGLDNGYYRIYGASCKYGEDNLRPNYNKTSQYIDITILDNTLYVGKIENQTNTNNMTLMDYTYAAGSEYKLYGQVDYSDMRTNPDGVVFYKTDLLLDIKKNGKTSTYVVDRGSIYNSATYGNMMFPCMMLDLNNDKMYVFHNSKDDDEYYGMKGFIYTSPISSVNFTRSTIYNHFNCGWFPYFIGPLSNGYPGLHHFSFAGYYELLTVNEDGEWVTYYLSDMYPADAEKDGKSHSPFLVVGDSRVSDDVAEYCPSDQDEESCKLLCVDPGVSGDFTIPETVEGNTVNSIASYAFSACDDITSITIPASITSIDEFAFGASRNLQSIIVLSPTPIDLSYTYENGESGEDSNDEKRFVLTPFELIDKSTCVLYVPRGCKEAYSLAIGWGDFQHIEEHDDLSSINDLPTKKVSADNMWYSPTGLVQKGKPTTKGIYIHNGKKFVVK